MSLFSMLRAESSESIADQEETEQSELSEAVLMDSCEETFPESQVLTDKHTEGINSLPAGESQSTDDITDTNQPASVDQGTLLDVSQEL